MSYRKSMRCRSLAGLIASIACCAVTQQALAQQPNALPPAGTPAPAASPPSANPSANPMANLLSLLVQRGVISRDEAGALLKQAKQDAAAAKAAPASAPVPEGTVRVPYVPEVVKREMREDIKKEVLAQAKAENWAAPNAVPPWVQKFRLYGDLRMRGEADVYPEGNDNQSGAFINFNAINTGAPFDMLGANDFPQRNVDKDRYRARLRARLGADVDLGDKFMAGLRIATGENNSPVSANQSLGAANNGQGGEFSKYAIWLDRAFLKYEPKNEEMRGFSVNVGRFDNPFFSPSTLVWADSLGFDGAAANYKFKVTERESNFVTIGAFPVFNTDLNFATNRPDKFASDDKWLFGGQYGTDWKVNKDVGVKLAGAYYYFDNIKGRLSSPCVVITAQDSCDTDSTRPSFAQFGNTYRPLRNVDPSSPADFQYFGLASGFQELVVNGRLDINRFDPFHISFDGEYVKNLAFDKNKAAAVAFNNFGDGGAYEGGDTGYYVGMTVGARSLEKSGDWNATLGYKYLESDAVVDGLTDSDFGLGGTNLKGFIIGANYALTSNVWTSFRFMSADSIGGSPYSVDVFQVDLSGRF